MRTRKLEIHVDEYGVIRPVKLAISIWTCRPQAQIASTGRDLYRELVVTEEC
jgi:hypothetical protein